MQVWRALAGSYSEVVLVCMSVRNGFMIEIYIVYAPFWHVPLTVPPLAQWRTERIEDDGRLENDSRDTEDD